MSAEATSLKDAADEALLVEDVPAKPVKPVKAPDPVAEIDRIDPVSDELTLTSGTLVKVQPLKARQFFKLLRIITRGGAGVLQSMGLSTRMSEEEFVGNLIALVVFAIPEAEEEAIEFVRSMVEIPNIPSDRKEAERLRVELDLELDNPELEDLITIIETVVKREGSDLKSLGKRLQTMFNLAEKTGQTKDLPKPT